MGSRRRQVLGVHAEDPVLSWIGPIGLALAAGTALIIDVHTRYLPGTKTLAQLMVDGPTLFDLSPGRSGVATIASGSMTSEELTRAVEVLGGRWPALVVRSDGKVWPGPTVPYRSILPGFLRPGEAVPSVWQPAIGVSVPSLPGPVLPRLGRRPVMAMLEGRTPQARRWVDSWRSIWEMPWA
ncbi:hypothetical protein BH23ACT4_BH23ACT4_10230 [soil metagenome]